MLILPTPLRDVSQEARPSARFLFLWELVISQEIPPTPSQRVRLVSYDEIVELDPTTKFYPFPIGFSAIEQNAEGDLPQIHLAIDNRGRWLTPYLDASNGFVDTVARVYLVNSEAVSLANSVPWTFRIADAEENAEAIQIRLELPNFFQRKMPQERVQAQVCQWAFGEEECGYIVNVSAAFTTCDHSLAACILRGDDERTRGLPVRHPRRFGAFRGIATVRRR